MERRSERLSVFMSASVEFAGRAIDVKLRNLSERGAMIEAPAMPANGSRLTFRKGKLAVGGRAVWVAGQCCGIAFDEQLSVTGMLRDVQAASRQRPPAAARRPGILDCRGLTSAQRELAGQWMWRPGRDLLGE